MAQSQTSNALMQTKWISRIAVALSLLFIPAFLFIVVVLSSLGGAGVYGYNGLLAINNLEPGFWTYLQITGILDAIALAAYAGVGRGPTYRRVAAVVVAALIIALFGAVMLTRGY